MRSFLYTADAVAGVVEWYVPSLVPGKQFIPVQHDLSDLLLKSEAAVVDGSANFDWVQMALDMQQVALRLFNTKAYLGAAAASLLRYKALVPWEVRGNIHTVNETHWLAPTNHTSTCFMCSPARTLHLSW